MQILIAEDERITRASLARQLESWGHQVVASEDGEQAWEKYKAGGFDIVITDWEMPRLSGLELITRIRETVSPNYVYLIMLTSRSDKSDVVCGIEAGADDFVSKPFDKEELRVRLLSGVRVVDLERSLSRKNVELSEANERIRHGLRAAARVQQSMLPHGNINTPKLCTAWTYVPTEELAGDAIGFHLIDDRYLVAYVLDVSGHGVPAALLSVSAMHAMEPLAGVASLLRDMSGKSGLGTVQRPSLASAEMNRRFRASDYDGRYLTMILTVLDTQTGQLHVTSAGHPPAIVMRGTSAVSIADAGGFPIAIMDGCEYEEQMIQLQPGDRVFLYSDGLLEQFNPTTREQFGTKRVESLLQTHAGTTAELLVTRVVDALTSWCGSRRFDDDVSLALTEWRG